MSDLRDMIDDTTERLLKKIDNWEVPQSDKKYVTIEKEVWESTLRVSMERAGKTETLQKQLEIALAYLDVIYGLRGGECFNCVEFARRARKKIKELNK